MDHPLIASLGSAALISAASLVGLVAYLVPRHRLPQVSTALLSFAVGGLLTASCLHLLPEAAETLPGGWPWALAAAAGGVALMAALRWAFNLSRWAQGSTGTVAVALASDALHNLLDGVLIGLAYLGGGPEAGLSVTLTILVHELPQELADFGILLHSGVPIRRALLANLLVALTAVVGAVVPFAFSGAEALAAGWLPGITAGALAYVGLSFCPVVWGQAAKGRGVRLLWVAVGAAVLLLALLAHDHH